jgi:hypothetical protein
VSLPAFVSDRVSFTGGTDDFEDWYQWVMESQLGDGLPAVPPTEERVAGMLASIGGDPQREVAKIPPTWAPATVEKIAICAVMAGCRPEYMPVVVAAVEAMTDPSVNLYGLQATTGYGAPSLIVNGPVARELDINSSTGAFGPGWRANATIGRAIKQICIAVGGGIAGVTDRSTFGWPGKYGFCFAENEDASPWEPFHVERGFAPDDSTVMVAGVNSILTLLVASPTGRSTLERLADSLIHCAGAMAGHLATVGVSGGDPILVLGVDDASVIARDGYSKQDIKEFLYEHVVLPVGHVPIDPAREDGMAERTLDQIRAAAPNVTADGMVHMTDTPDDLIVLVAGGTGCHSTLLPMWMGRMTRPAVRRIDWSPSTVTPAVTTLT